MDAGKALMFEAVFNQINLPITIIKANSPQFTIVAMNSNRFDAPGTPKDAVGRDAFDVYKPWDAASEQQFNALKNGFIKAITEKKQVNLPLLYFEIPLPGKTEIKRAWVQNEITPVIGANGEVEYLLSMARNVTDIELNRIALEEAKNKEQHLIAELAAANDSLKATNEEVLTVNEELACTNEELNDANRQLLTANKKLTESRLSLEKLNNELEERILTRTNALSVSEQRFREMMNTLPQIAWTSTPEGDVSFYNRRWFEYTGLSPEDTIARGWTEVIHPDDLQRNLDNFTIILADKAGAEFEVREKNVAGKYRWHLVRMQPVKDDKDNVQFWIGTATDIEDLKQLQQQKDDFISIASHELKTPLTSLKASVQLLDKMKDRLAEEMREKLVNQVKKSTDRVSFLVDDLLNVSKLNQGQLHINKKWFPLTELIDESSGQTRLKDAFAIKITGDTSLKVFADLERINQVLSNFIDNATKYAAESDEILIDVKRGGGLVKISVTDKGPGIPKEKQQRIFERYYRADKDGIQYSGLGLGLYISAEIIKKHNGRIGVESEVGNGSTFWITLPAED